MEQKLHLYFTRVAMGMMCAMALAVITMSMVNETHHISLPYHTPILIITLTLLVVSFLIPRSRFIPYMVPTAMLFYFVIVGEYMFRNGQIIPGGGILLFPIYTFFFLGVRTGLIYTILLGIWAIGAPYFHNISESTYHISRVTDFPFLYIYSVAICSMLELVRRRLIAHLQHMAIHDELTGLFNRSGFSKEFEQMLLNNELFHVAILDLDYFTKLNSSLGNDIGDTILRKCSEILTREPTVELPCRWYGDQFIFVHRGNRESMDACLDVVRREVLQIPVQMELDFVLSYCVGLVQSTPRSGVSSKELAVRANVALLEAKSLGHNTYHYYNEGDDVHHIREMTIETIFPFALKNHEVQVFFQPKVSTTTGLITGMEALSRWTHSEYGNISPLEFIPAAEKTGTITILGEYVLRESLAHLKRCHDAGFTDLKVSVNISPRHLIQSDFLKRLVSICTHYDIKPHFVCLEVTESILVRSAISELLLNLQNVGFVLSLDDFGTGYSSLSYLSTFRFDELKIDKSFTDKINSSNRDRALFEMIVNLSKRFHMKTVVEGLETESQKVLVESLGIEEIQGWYYSKALPGDEFMVYLESMNRR